MNVKPIQQSVEHEDWLHLEKTKSSLKKAVAWAAKNPPKSSDPEQLRHFVGANLAYEELNFFNKHGNNFYDF